MLRIFCPLQFSPFDPSEWWWCPHQGGKEGLCPKPCALTCSKLLRIENYPLDFSDAVNQVLITEETLYVCKVRATSVVKRFHLVWALGRWASRGHSNYGAMRKLVFWPQWQIWSMHALVPWVHTCVLPSPLHAGSPPPWLFWCFALLHPTLLQTSCRHLCFAPCVHVLPVGLQMD